MDANGWTVVIGAIFLGIVQVTGMILSYLRDKDKLSKLNTIKEEIHENTALTKEGTARAESSAQVAANTAKSAESAATQTKTVIEDINHKLNGNLEASISKAVVAALDPIKAIIESHLAKDGSDKMAIKERIDTLHKYTHESNHDILGAMQTQSNKIEIILQRFDAMKPIS